MAALPAATLDVPCLTCGYPLRGLPSGRCPECSADHDRRYLTTGQPPLGPRPWSAEAALALSRPAWIAAAAACGARAG